MSILKGKRVLVIVNDQVPLNNLLNELRKHGMQVLSLPCEGATINKIEESKADIILLDYLHEGSGCKHILQAIRSSDSIRPVPIFMLLEETNDKIQEAFSLGMTDYFTLNEDSYSVIQKLNIVLDSRDEFTGDAAIDITPEEVSITTKGIRVYIVEDDPLLRNLLSIQLDKSSFPYEFSKDGKMIVPAVKQFKPNVIILDLMLPGTSGFDVLSEIRADESLKNIPVLVFSNRDGQDDRQRAEELGVAGFYVKAMTDLSELVEKIELIAKKN